MKNLLKKVKFKASYDVWDCKGNVVESIVVLTPKYGYFIKYQEKQYREKYSPQKLEITELTELEDELYKYQDHDVYFKMIKNERLKRFNETLVKSMFEPIIQEALDSQEIKK